MMVAHTGTFFRWGRLKKQAAPDRFLLELETFTQLVVSWEGGLFVNLPWTERFFLGLRVPWGLRKTEE